MCIGLNEVMASAGRSQLLSFMDQLIPTIRTALCDRFVLFLLKASASDSLCFFILLKNLTFLTSTTFVYSALEVRESAGLAFSTLYKVPVLNSVAYKIVVPFTLYLLFVYFEM